MPTPFEKLEALDAWHSAYRAVQARADRIVRRLIRVPAGHSGPGYVYCAKGILWLYDPVQGEVDCRRLAKRTEIVRILTARPAFQAVQARYDAMFAQVAA